MRKILLTGLLALLMLSIGVRVEAAEWETDLVQAVKTAKASGKYVLVDFTGSDWCPWCMKLEEEVFSQPEFKKYAAKNLICVLVDFPQDKYQSDEQKAWNKLLAKKYGVTGYPTIIMFSPNGGFVLKSGYQYGGAENYVNYLKEAIAGYKGK